MSFTTIAGTAGRITGTAARGLIWLHRNIDWAEVGSIVLHGIQVLIVLTLMAGRATRRAWDAVPVLSEQLGRWYARLMVPSPVPATTTQAAIPAPIAPVLHPLAELGQQLEHLTRRELQSLAGTRRRVSKRELVMLLVAA